MCGIYISCNQSQHTHPPSDIISELRCRGPDSIQTRLVSGLRPWYLTAVSSVLSLRGDDIVCQPIFDDPESSQCFLMWNGEVWRYGETVLHGNDTRFIFHLLLQSVKNVWLSKLSRKSAIQVVADTLSKVTGPFAFVFLDAFHQILYYGRDILGRRSLLLHRPSISSIEISSTAGEAQKSQFQEIKSDGIYMLDLASAPTTHALGEISDRPPAIAPLHIPWQGLTNPRIFDISMVRHYVLVQTLI